MPHRGGVDWLRRATLALEIENEHLRRQLAAQHKRRIDFEARRRAAYRPSPQMRLVDPKPDPTAEVRSQWSRCCEAGGSYVTEYLRLGSLLTGLKREAKKHGAKFGDWFKGDGKLPFSQATANRAMRMSENAALSDSSHVTNLPHDVGVVAILADIQPAKLAKLIESGDVSAKTTRAEAAAIVLRNQVVATEPVEHYHTNNVDTDAGTSPAAGLSTQHEKE